MKKSISVIQAERIKYKPHLAAVLRDGFDKIKLVEGSKTGAIADAEALRGLFELTFGQPGISLELGQRAASTAQPYNVGVVLSGGPAAGGHNVIIGLLDGMKRLNPDNRLFGFKQGPGGIVDNKYIEITPELVQDYRNTGGFDLIQSGRTKIEKPEQFEACLKTCSALNLKILLVIGGDDSNTNAAVLAEFFKKKGAPIQVLGAPKTIDGDLKNEHIEASFGFDTACKTYAEMVGNICRDAISSAKYWHFIKLMGRSASHITLEVALQTRVNVALIGEEVKEKAQTLGEVVSHIADVVATRSAAGKNYGVVLVPEGLVEFIPEMGQLISKLNDLLAAEAKAFGDIQSLDGQIDFVHSHLPAELSQLYRSLPAMIQKQLIADRDPHGNVQVSMIETEKLLASMVEDALAKRSAQDQYKGKFLPVNHFFGYEGRCAMPSNFDADYAYNLGMVACLLGHGGKTGYLSALRGLDKTAEQWTPAGIPLTSIMNLERRHGKDKPVIRKALVELEGRPFREFASLRQAWAREDAFCYPGPIQYHGPSEICDRKPLTLMLEKGGEIS